jgi:PAS domain S-box-containing protein
MARRADNGRRSDGDTAIDGEQARPISGASPELRPEILVRQLRAINEQLVVASARQQELAERAQRQAAQGGALLNSLNEGVVVVDSAGQLVLINPSGRELLGVTPADETRTVASWTQTRFFSAGGQPLASDDQPIARALRGESFTDYETLLRRPDGHHRRVTFNGSAVRDERGLVDLAICVFRDVTNLRELEHAKEEYVALISHDLRGPLTNIIGRADLLYASIARSAFGLEQDHQNVEAIKKSARQMNAMIQDLVDTARIESGQIVLRPVQVDLAALVHSVAESMLSIEEQSRLRVDAEEPVALVLVDPGRIQRVIANLLSNALKYSPTTSLVEVRIATAEDRVVVTIADRGVGISSQDRAHLFEKYYRSPESRGTEGLGLGLYIARLVVEASGGQIWAASEPGKGSVFTFSLPVAMQTEVY